MGQAQYQQEPNRKKNAAPEEIREEQTPRELERGNGLLFRREHELTPAELVDKLPGGDRTFFTLLFAGGAAKKIYRLFEFGNA